MMMEIATAGDFIVSANSTDVTAKIPTAGMACRAVKITNPSCCREFVTQVCMQEWREISHARGTQGSSDVQTDGVQCQCQGRQCKTI
jgi:hypothetical protein